MKRTSTAETDSWPHQAHYSAMLFSWAAVWLISLLLKAGISPALRGAFVGADGFIQFSEHAGNFFSQAAAISTSTMLIILALSSLRAGSKLMLRLLLLLTASLPTALLFIAQRATLPHAATGVSAICAGSVVLLGTLLSQVRGAPRWIAICCGFSLILRTLGEFAEAIPLSSDVLRVGPTVALALCFVATLLTLVFLHRGRSLTTAAILGAGTLLGAAAIKYGQISSPPFFVVARSVAEMTSRALAPGPACWLLATVAVLAIANIPLWYNNPLRLILVSLLLVSLAQLTPLTCGIAALAGVFLTVFYGVESPQASSPGHTHVVRTVRHPATSS